MQTYHIRIIDKKQISKITLCIMLTFIIFLSVIFGQGIFLYTGQHVDINTLKSFVIQSIPTSSLYLKSSIKWHKSFFGFDINEPISIIANQILVVNATKIIDEEKSEVSAKPVEASNEKAKEKPEVNKIAEVKANTQNAKGLLSSADGVLVKNQTTYNVDAKSLIDEKLGFNFKQKGAQVLIVHTHTSESYSPSNQNYYMPSDPNRTQDPRYNVVRVGDELAKTLKGMGVNVIHDTTVHDYPSYNGSYKSCLESVNDILSKNPSIKIVIDVHRDAMVQADKTKLKLCTEIDGKKTAQVMIVTGTDQGGLKHPNWKENLKFAMKLQRRFVKMYPTLARPIDLRKERFNTHTTNASIILEIGSNGNTLEEATSSAVYVGKALASMIKDIK